MSRVPHTPPQLPVPPAKSGLCRSLHIRERRSSFQVVYAALADTSKERKGKRDDFSSVILYNYISEDLGYCLIVFN